MRPDHGLSAAGLRRARGLQPHLAALRPSKPDIAFAPRASAIRQPLQICTHWSRRLGGHRLPFLSVPPTYRHWKARRPHPNISRRAFLSSRRATTDVAGFVSAGRPRPPGLPLAVAWSSAAIMSFRLRLPGLWPCPACKGQVSGPSRKNVSISPFPFTSTMPCGSALKRARTRAWVAAEIMMRLGRPCDSMRLATFTASPHTS